MGLRSFRSAGLTLIGLLVYDVFWVFGSPSVIGQNVMLKVATSDLITGPTRILFPKVCLEGTTMIFNLYDRLPASMHTCIIIMGLFIFIVTALSGILVRSMSGAPPNQVAGGVGEAAGFDFSLLGLGDIAVPGLLACLALRYDASRCSLMLNSCIIY